MKRIIAASVANLLIVVCLALNSNAQAKLTAGIAKSDITPPVGTPLAGYGGRMAKPSTGVHDPTEARALIIDNGTERIAFVSVDHLGFDHGKIEDFKGAYEEYEASIA